MDVRPVRVLARASGWIGASLSLRSGRWIFAFAAAGFLGDAFVDSDDFAAGTTVLVLGQPALRGIR